MPLTEQAEVPVAGGGAWAPQNALLAKRSWDDPWEIARPYRGIARPD